MKKILLVLCIILLCIYAIVGYLWWGKKSTTQINDGTKPARQIDDNNKPTIQTNASSVSQDSTLKESLDSVLENLIEDGKLESIESLTDEKCAELKRTYNVPEKDSNAFTPKKIDEQSCHYAAMQHIKANILELIAKKHIITDERSLDSILRYKIIAFLNEEMRYIEDLENVLGFKVPSHLIVRYNVCETYDGFLHPVSCEVYMQIFDELALYVAQEQNLPQEKIQDYHNAFETRTTEALGRSNRQIEGDDE